MASSNEIVQDFFSFIRVYRDGRVERSVGTDIVPPSLSSPTGVVSKDVVIDASTGVSARLYVPNIINNRPRTKLPILMYYHGGGFCMESAFSSTYHGYVESLVARANVLAVSVNYRLAPEHPIPAAYDDSWLALQWVASHADGSGPEAWLTNHADFDSVFVAGDSSGGNIAHDISLRARRCGVTIQGVVLVQPYFWGTQRMESEVATQEWGRPVLDVNMIDALWAFVCPSTADNDDPRINPLAEGAPSLTGLGCERVLVCVAEKDLLRDRGVAYYQTLMESGWGGDVELFETKGEDHGFHLFNPGCTKAQAMMRRLLAFFRH